MSTNDDATTAGSDASDDAQTTSSTGETSGAAQPTNPYANLTAAATSDDSADDDPFARLRRDGDAHTSTGDDAPTPVIDNPYANLTDDTPADAPVSPITPPAFVDSPASDADASMSASTSAPAEVPLDSSGAVDDGAPADAPTLDAPLSEAPIGEPPTAEAPESAEDSYGSTAAAASSTSFDTSAPPSGQPYEAPAYGGQSSQAPASPEQQAPAAQDQQTSAVQPGQSYGESAYSATGTGAPAETAAASTGLAAGAGVAAASAASISDPYAAPAWDPYAAPAADPYAQQHTAQGPAAPHHTPPVAPHSVTSLPLDAPYAAPNSGQLVRRDDSADDVPKEVYIGDISVTREYLRSPQGVIPTRGTHIQVHNRTQMTNAIPTWAIIVTVVGFFIISFFSLLFLLVKEQRFTGGYEVIATGPGGTLASFIPVTQQNAGFVWSDLHSRAELARKVIATA